MSENEDLLKLCRCCQCEVGLKSLRASNKLGRSEKNYEKMLRDVFDIHLAPYLAVSPTVCSGCVLELQSAAAFKERVLQCEARLQMCYSHLNVKHEPESHTAHTTATEWNLNDIKLDKNNDEPAQGILDSDVDESAPGIESDDDQPLSNLKDACDVSEEDLRKKIEEEGDWQIGYGRVPEGAAAEPESYKETRERKRKSYFCSLCSKEFLYKGSLEIHLKAHKGEKTLPCLLCGTKYCSHKELNRHIAKKHFNGERYKCDLCPEHFEKLRDLKKHINIHFQDRYKCDLCTKVFRRKKNLDSHKKTHSGEKEFTCNVCNKSFGHNQTLKVHMYVHTGEKPHICHECGNTFTQSNHLKRHIFRIHRGLKKYACKVCHKKFSSKTYMLTHEKLHKGGKPYSCQVCRKAFTLNTSLRVHLKLHTGIKPFNCTHCNRNFAQMSSLKLHERSHTGEKPFSCGVCKKHFSDKGYLKIHMRVHTGERPFSCSICKKLFRERGQMKRHMRTHTGEKFTCNICNKQVSNLTKHMKVHVKSGANVNTVADKIYICTKNQFQVCPNI